MMTPEEREPTQDELLAMAYVDEELAAEARAQFERRLASEPGLVREVAELKKLAVLARQTAPPEPMDFEWQRLEKELVHVAGGRLGLLLIGVGLAGGSLWLAFELFRSEVSLAMKVAGGAGLAGVLLLFYVTLRARLRTLPYDPYTEVKR